MKALLAAVNFASSRALSHEKPMRMLIRGPGLCPYPRLFLPSPGAVMAGGIGCTATFEYIRLEVLLMGCTILSAMSNISDRRLAQLRTVRVAKDELSTERNRQFLIQSTTS